MGEATFEELVRKAKAYVRYLEDAGLSFAPCPEKPPASVKGRPSAVKHSGSNQDELITLRQEVVTCTKCDELAGTRRQVVFGSGSAKARLMFVGEAPGFEEDVQGLPFVGKAGQLLTRILEAMGLTRNDVFIANVLKCRPPGNRNPLPDEIMNCQPYLAKQIEIIQPKVICALGNFAAQVLLKTEKSISALRGTFYDYQGIKVLPTFHPAYLLRNPGEKRKVWEDMKLIMKELGLSSKS